MPANRLGGLWKKTLKSGAEILSGSIKVGDTSVRVTCWPIEAEKKAENPKRPDYNVVEDTFVPQARPSTPDDHAPDDYRRAVRNRDEADSF